jgi:hypothetical protein
MDSAAVDREVQRAAEILGEEFAKEAQRDLANLRRSPSTDAIRFLDYWDTLDAKDRAELSDAWAWAAALGFFPGPMITQRFEEFRTGNAAVQKFHESVMRSAQYSMGLRYMDLRMRKAVLNDAQSMAMMAETRSKLDWTPRDDLRADLVPDPDRIVVLKAADLRKPIDELLRGLFATEKKKLMGGETEYEGTLEGREIKVGIDFNARGIQLRWGMSFPDPQRRIFARHITYESLWGAGYHGWDYLTEENQSRSLEWMREQIVYLVKLMNRVAPV